MKCAVYRIVHRESGKDYVGVSVQPKKRWRQHRADALHKPEKSPVFYLALQKYGPEAFDWNVISWASSTEGASTLEYLATKYLGLGLLNTVEGGSVPPSWAGKKHSKETKAKISASMMGKKHYKLGTRPPQPIKSSSEHCRTEEHRERCRQLGKSGVGSRSQVNRFDLSQWRGNNPEAAEADRKSSETRKNKSRTEQDRAEASEKCKAVWVIRKQTAKVKSGA